MLTFVSLQSYIQVKIHTDFATLSDVKAPVVTIGTFDGMHTGHRTILERLKEAAKEIGGETVLLTFYPHPRMVLYPDDHNLQLLNSPEEKAQLLEQAGIEHLVIVPFSIDFSRLSAFDYVRDLLVHGLHAHTVVVGYDHRFGRNREGSHNTLVELSELFGFLVEEIPAYVIDEMNVSSTKIRETLRHGDVAEAARYLGYRYTLSGIVTKGDGKGKTFGFPTANLRVDYDFKFIPSKGVYAVDVLHNNIQYKGVLNIGVRPTVHQNGLETIEVHLLNFDEEIYDQKITVIFKKKLRDEMKFGSIDALKTQIEKDALEASVVL